MVIHTGPEPLYLRTVKVPSSHGSINQYVRVVEAYRQDGKVKQPTIADLGRQDLLTALLPQLQRLLHGPNPAPDVTESLVDILEALTWGPVLVLRALFDPLGLWAIWDACRGQGKRGASFSDRAFVLIANRLIHPSREHGLARWLETDFVCDRQGRRFLPQWHQRRRLRVPHRQLDSWYGTLDQVLKAKRAIEVALYGRWRDLFSLRPDLVLFDITSTFFEGQGPRNLAEYGYSRDGKPQKVPVVVGLVMVAGWPIAPYVLGGQSSGCEDGHGGCRRSHQAFSVWSDYFCC